MIDRAAILRLVPHAGSMCLLDRVLEWGPDQLVAETDSHRRHDNPLRRDGQLSAIHLIEYGAQAMAVHGGLLAAQGGGRAAPGLLVSARGVRLACARLDDLAQPLTVVATRLLADAGGSLYRFEIRAAEMPLGSGRVAVVFAAGAA